MGTICCCDRREVKKENNPDHDNECKHLNDQNSIKPITKIKPIKNKSIEIESLHEEKIILFEQDIAKPNSNSDFFIKIWIETLEISYKLCDDFGNFFKPFVEVIFDKQSKTMNTMDEEKLNLSNISENADVNISYSANMPSMRKSGTNSALLAKERFYYFKNGVDFNGNDENKYSSILFSIKNENTNGYLKILPSITIGQIRIPISTLLNQKDKCFDGYIYLKLREVIDIGQLKVKIQCGDNSLDNSMSMFNSDVNNNNKMIKTNDDVKFLI